MPPTSLLSAGSATLAPDDPAPACVADLGLDRAIAALRPRRDPAHTLAVAHTPLADVVDVHARQAVFADLTDPDLRAALETFLAALRAVDDDLAEYAGCAHRPQSLRWLLDASSRYAAALRTLVVDLAGCDLRAELLCRAVDALREHLASPEFVAWEAEAVRVREALDAVRYSVHLKGLKVAVRHASGEADQRARLAALFAPLLPDEPAGHQVRLNRDPQFTGVEERILDAVVALHPDAFAALEGFAVAYPTVIAPLVDEFARDVAFYLAYLELIAPLERAGLACCLPEFVDGADGWSVTDAFDLSFALNEVGAGRAVVTNGVTLGAGEQAVVVTGPNQGGKSTFARALGQVHYLAGLGAPVPASTARIVLPDRVATHMSAAEDVTRQRGRLADELVAVREILATATPATFVVLNEPFSSTTLADARGLALDVLERLAARGARSVVVTFIDELASAPAVVSLVGGIDPVDPARRTFALTRRPADGRAYAFALADRYGLTYEAVSERLTC